MRYVGRVERFWEQKGKKMVNVRWFYHPEEVKASAKRLSNLKYPVSQSTTQFFSMSYFVLRLSVLYWHIFYLPLVYVFHFTNFRKLIPSKIILRLLSPNRYANK